MNILILDTDIIEQKLINLCLKSNFLDHIYTASKNPIKSIPNLEYETFNELAQKAKILQIDLILLNNQEFIKSGVVEFLKEKRLNVLSVNKKWFNLENQRLVAKQLMNHYSINNPMAMKAPIVFPVIIKSNNRTFTKIAYNMKELVEIKENFPNEITFLEEHLEGKVYYLLSLWDGKNILNFPMQENLTEVQIDRLDLYKTKLNIMLSDESPDFMGFIISKLIWTKNDWYVLEFIMHINSEVDLSVIKKDFLYILNSAIFQKLNEISY